MLIYLKMLRELYLARLLAAYGELRMKRIASLPTLEGVDGEARLCGAPATPSFLVAAFARTLKVHRATLQRMLDGEEEGLVAAAAVAFVEGPTSEDSAEAPVSRTIERRKLSTRTMTQLPRRPRLSELPVPRKATCARNCPRSTTCCLLRSDMRPGQTHGCVG